MSEKPSKTLLGLTTIIVILIGISASIILTQDEPTEPEIITANINAELDLPKNTTVSTFTNLLDQGDIALSNRNFKSALSYYVAAYQVDPESTDPFLRIINVYLTNENYPVALENIKLAAKQAPNNPETVLTQIRYHLAQNDFAAASLAIDGINPPTEPIALYDVITAIIANDHERANQQIKKLLPVVQNPSIKKASQTISDAYDLFNTFESGNNAYRDTLLGQALVQIGEYKLARDMFYRAVESQNDFRDAWVGLGYAFLQIKNYEQAEEALNRAKQIDPYKAETYFYQAIVTEELGNNKRALGLLTQAKNYKYDNNTEIAEHLATNYYALKQYENAIPNYEQVINEKKVPIDYFIAPIWIHLEKTNSYDKALALAQKAQGYYPERAESYNYLGWVQLYRGEYESAKNNLTQAISKNPQLAAAYLNFGLLFKQQGKLAGSLPYFQKASNIAGNTNDPSIHNRAETELETIKQIIKQQEKLANPTT